MGVNARFGVSGPFFLKGRLMFQPATTDDTTPTPPLDYAHLSALGWLSASPDIHQKCSNVLSTCLFSARVVPRCRAF